MQVFGLKSTFLESRKITIQKRELIIEEVHIKAEKVRYAEKELSHKRRLLLKICGFYKFQFNVFCNVADIIEGNGATSYF